jgi:hypothetical protein
VQKHAQGDSVPATAHTFWTVPLLKLGTDRQDAAAMLLSELLQRLPPMLQRWKQAAESGVQRTPDPDGLAFGTCLVYCG